MNLPPRTLADFPIKAGTHTTRNAKRRAIKQMQRNAYRDAVALNKAARRKG